MKWVQKQFSLAPKPRGFHLVTEEILQHVPEIGRISRGIAHIFIQHTSASLCLNENADPSVRTDMEMHFNTIVPENVPYYVHTLEGADDMPAHIKSVLLGASISVPITAGRPAFGTWQGIYLCEHRNRGGARRIVVTAFGE